MQRIRQLPENVGKPLNSIDWNDYPISFGETIELCAGLMDKGNNTPVETICEEILEECGYIVGPTQIEPIKNFLYVIFLYIKYYLNFKIPKFIVCCLFLSMKSLILLFLQKIINLKVIYEINLKILFSLFYF